MQFLAECPFPLCMSRLNVRVRVYARQGPEHRLLAKR